MLDANDSSMNGAYNTYIHLFRQRLSNWKASKRTRQYRKAWWVVVVHCCIVKFTSFQRDGRRCYEYLFACAKRNKIQLFRQRLSNWKALKRTRQYRKAWWVVVVHCCIVEFTSFQRDGRRCCEYLFACVKRNTMDSELLTCLFKIY